MPSSRLAKISLFAMDVDGVLTDGQITYDSQGSEIKSFNIKDGLGIKLLQKGSIQAAIITGRLSPMVERRAKELGINHLIQGREDKADALTELAQKCGLSLEEIAYMGDDLPDLGALQLAGIGIAVADADPRIRKAATYVTSLEGGQGAVREACEWLLSEQGKLDRLLADFNLQT